MRKYQYSTKEFNFRGIVEEYLKNTDLENLHRTDRFEKKLTSAAGDYGDQKQELHRRFYNKMDEDPSFISLYKKFVGEVVQPLFEDETYYQEFPTFRVHQPDNVCVFDWHRDMDFGHSKHEINIYLPITKTYGSNTIWSESQEGKKDYSPMELEYGEFNVWDGAKLFHGNKNNDTNQTRVSFDFRILPVKKYDESNAKNCRTLTKGTSFALGGYFQELG
jgi:hypothetical protein|tara:strand:- start:2178 stop:2834 length:657 start_codon:yes stop_codon:yes gene_type:complete